MHFFEQITWMVVETSCLEHLRTIYNMSPSLSVVQDDCFVCGVSNVVYQHTAEEKHRNLVKVRNVINGMQAQGYFRP